MWWLRSHGVCGGTAPLLEHPLPITAIPHSQPLQPPQLHSYKRFFPMPLRVVWGRNTGWGSGGIEPACKDAHQALQPVSSHERQQGIKPPCKVAHSPLFLAWSSMGRVDEEGVAQLGAGPVRRKWPSLGSFTFSGRQEGR